MKRACILMLAVLANVLCVQAATAAPGIQIVIQADVAITKTDGQSAAVPGTSTTYTIVVSNTGPSAVTGASVSDPLPAGATSATWGATASTGGGIVSGPASGSGALATTVDLPVGATVTFTFTATISPSATGSISNTATVSPPPGVTDTNPGNNTATDTDTLTPQADLAITKTDGVTTVVPGTSTTYTIVVSNTGPSAVTGATVSDPLPAGVSSATWAVTGFTGGGNVSGPSSGTGALATTVNLPVNASVTFTFTPTISPSATGTISNTATVSPPAGVTDADPGDNTATDSDTLTPQADLSITKTDGVTTYVPGTSTTYTIIVTNNGPSTVTGAAVSDLFPTVITAASWTAVASPGSSVTQASGTGNISTAVTLLPGGFVIFTAVAQISASATGTISNTATVSPPPGVTDTNPGNNTATDTDNLVAPAIQIVKLVNGQDGDLPPGPHVAVGSTVTFTYVVTNTGNVPLANVAVTDNKLGPITSFTGDTNGNGLLDLTETWTYTRTATALAGQQTNIGTVTAQDSSTGATVSDTNPANYFGDAPAINIVKFVNGQDADTPTGPRVAAGSTVTFTYVVTNTGNVPLANVAVTDNKLGLIAGPPSGDANGNGLLDLTETWVYTRTATALAGQQTNVGTATGQDANNPPATTVTDNNPANYFGDAPAINIVKFVNGQDANSPTGPQVAPGSTVTFTYVVTNTGNVPVANVAVTDDKLGLITSFTGDTNGNGLLDLTETWVYTRTATALAGQQTNVGTVTGQDVNSPPGTAVADTDPANYFGGILVDLAVTKTDGRTTYTPGTAITYTITVTNAGPSSAASFSIADNVPVAITGVSVTCVVTGTGNCGTNGSSGNSVILTAASLAPGAGNLLTMTVAGSVSTSASGPLVNTVTVAADAGSTDLNPANNSATDTDNQRTGVVTDVASFFAYDPVFAGGVNVAVGDVTGDGVAEIVTGAGPGGGAHVRAFSLAGGDVTEVAGFFAYDPAFAGGVNVAVGDVTGDGVAEIITGAGPGGGPHVRVFSLAGGVVTEVAGAGFFAYDPAFRGGVSVAAGDVNGDGVAEIITGAGPGGGPHVRVFSLAGGVVTEVAGAGFFAYDPAFRGGVSVAAGDVTGDGVAEIITGAGPGGGAHVRAFSLAGGGVTEVAGFFAYDPAFRGGVRVAAGDVNGDGVAEIITGAGAGGGPHVRAFGVAGGVTEVAGFFAYDPAFRGGVRVAAGDVNGDGVAEIITGAGPGGGPHVRVLDVSGVTIK